MTGEVATQQLKGFRKALSAEGDSLDSMLLSMRLPELDWDNTQHRIDWQDYCLIMDAIQRHRSEDWFVQRGADSVYDDEAQIFRDGLLLGFDTAGRALEWLCAPYGPLTAVSPFLSNTIKMNVPDRSYLLRSIIRADLTPHSMHHCFSKGVLMEFPRVLGELPARITITHHSDGADYDITFRGTTISSWFRRQRGRMTAKPHYLKGVGETYLSMTQRQQELQEEQLRSAKLQERASRLERQESLGFLASGAAHDFNNLLAVVMAQLELMQMDGASNPEKIREVIDTCYRGHELTRRLLAYSQDAPVLPRVIKVAKVFERVTPMLNSVIQGERRLVVVQEDANAEVYVGEGQLENAILNLVVNARDALEDNGRVEVSCASVKIPEVPGRAGELVPGEYVKVSVADDGCGIDPDTASRIFDPYFTTKGESGTGLGLSTIWGFVKQAGGHVYLTTAVGKGSRFDLLLPRWTG